MIAHDESDGKSHQRDDRDRLDADLVDVEDYALRTEVFRLERPLYKIDQKPAEKIYPPAGVMPHMHHVPAKPRDDMPENAVEVRRERALAPPPLARLHRQVGNLVENFKVAVLEMQHLGQRAGFLQRGQQGVQVPGGGGVEAFELLSVQHDSPDIVKAHPRQFPLDFRQGEDRPVPVQTERDGGGFGLDCTILHRRATSPEGRAGEDKDSVHRHYKVTVELPQHEQGRFGAKTRFLPPILGSINLLPGIYVLC